MFENKKTSSAYNIYFKENVMYKAMEVIHFNHYNKNDIV